MKCDRKVKWLGNQTVCDICKKGLDRFDTFYDARIQGSTTWAVMCLECWQYLGSGVGTGFGQEYDSKTREKIR